MAKKNNIEINVEYGILRAVCFIVGNIPYKIAMSLARGISFIAVDCFRFKRERTLERLRGVFPGKSEKELIGIARESLCNILQTAIEMTMAPKMTRQWMDKHVQDGLKYKEKLQKYVDEGNGVVIMVPHSGNWYMAAWSMAKYGLSLFSIAAKQRNPKIYNWMKRQYGDIEVLERGSAKTMVEIKEKLREGKAFAILPDLRSPTADVQVEFLGGKANVSHAGAMFAVNANSPIVVAAMYRKNGRHVFDHIATLRPNVNNTDKKSEAIRLTQHAMRLLDKRIRQRPEFWYWYNKRWILQPL